MRVGKISLVSNLIAEQVEDLSSVPRTNRKVLFSTGKWRQEDPWDSLASQSSLISKILPFCPNKMEGS